MADIKWQEVESSNISAIGYDEEKQELYVRFSSGAEYAYHEVPTGIYQDFLDADSKGKYFYQHIKGRYQWDKL